jgi:hypothetical protein
VRNVHATAQHAVLAAHIKIPKYEKIPHRMPSSKAGSLNSSSPRTPVLAPARAMGTTTMARRGYTTRNSGFKPSVPSPRVLRLMWRAAARTEICQAAFLPTCTL